MSGHRSSYDRFQKLATRPSHPCPAQAKTLLESTSRAAALEAARATDGATEAFAAALDAFRGEVYDVIDMSSVIATKVAAEHRRRACARALRACVARSKAFAAFLDAGELLLAAAPVRARKKPSFFDFGTPKYVDATVVVTSKGHARVVVCRAVADEVDQADLLAVHVADAAPQGGGGCCAAGAVALPPAPDAPCAVALAARPQSDGKKRRDPKFVDDRRNATRFWTDVARVLPGAAFRPLAPRTILALADDASFLQ